LSDIRRPSHTPGRSKESILPAKLLPPPEPLKRRISLNSAQNERENATKFSQSPQHKSSIWKGLCKESGRALTRCPPMAMMDTMSDKISDGPGNRVSGPLKCQIDRKPCGNTPRDQREKDCSTGIRDTHLTVPIGDSIVAASTSTPNVNAGQTIRPTDNSTKHLPSRSVQSSKKRPVDGRSTDPDSMPCGIRDRLGKVPSEQHLSNTDQHPNCPDGGGPSCSRHRAAIRTRDLLQSALSRAPDNPGRDATSRRLGNGLNPTQFESRQQCASGDTMQTGRQ
jgi:hypothetical protein